MPQAYYAGFVRRAGAALLDGLIVSIPGAAAHQAGITTGSTWHDFAVESAIWLPYYVAFLVSPWQATPGKRAFGIKVTDLEGRRIGLGRSTVRYVASLLSAFALLIGYLMVPFTKKRQAMHDMIAGTLVVSAETQPGQLPADHQVMPLPGRVVAAVAASFFAFMAYVMASAFLLEKAEEGGVPAATATGSSFTLTYALYRFPFFGGERQLVREGTRTYGLGDVLVLPGPAGPYSSVKRVEVVDGFSIDAHIYRESAVQGFGLTLEKGHGFSWDWFDLEDGYVFRKLQGGGRIHVRMDRTDGLEEVIEILFLDDITLQVDRHFLIPFTRGATEQLVVKKGSVLALRE